MEAKNEEPKLCGSCSPPSRDVYPVSRYGARVRKAHKVVLTKVRNRLKNNKRVSTNFYIARISQSSAHQDSRSIVIRRKKARSTRKPLVLIWEDFFEAVLIDCLEDELYDEREQEEQESGSVASSMDSDDDV
jgi:outer membrane protein assembly factor BamD (BamD/ComL family)